MDSNVPVLILKEMKNLCSEQGSPQGVLIPAHGSPGVLQFRLTASSPRRLRVVPFVSVPTTGPIWTKAAEPTVLLAVGVAAQAPVFAAYSVNVGVLPTAPALDDFPRRLHSQVADSEQQEGQQTGLHFASTLVFL